jgi:hypothetical protein
MISGRSKASNRKDRGREKLEMSHVKTYTTAAGAWSLLLEAPVQAGTVSDEIAVYDDHAGTSCRHPETEELS